LGRKAAWQEWMMKALGRGSLASYVKIALDVAAVAFWIAAVAVALAAIGYAGLMIAIHGGMLTINILAVDSGRGLIRNLTTTHWQVAAPGLLAAGLIVGGGLIVIRRLKALFQSFSTGDPFAPGNSAHLRVIWITLACIELGRYAIAGLASLLVMAAGQPDAAHIKIGIRFDPMVWFMIAVVVVLAEVFREGARLKREQELTI